jgi:NAD(P)-dependent dehydrogenase (short-subunit alcohol dehydrogenase family)
MRALFDATGEVLIVTGGAAGIGAAVAARYAELGGTAEILDVVDAPEFEGRPGINTHRVDVSDRAAVLTAIADVIARHGRVDGLIAGAAVQTRTPIADMDPDEWRHTHAVNLDGVIWAIQGVLPQMRAQRAGSIVVFSSGLAHQGRAGASAYASSKGAIVPLAKSLAAEVAADNVRVNVVFPGVIDTEQFRRANPGAERAHWEKTTGVGTPIDVVGPLLYLLSDAATMTGSILSRDRAFPSSRP